MVTGGPVDVVIETGIRLRPYPEAPMEDVRLARSEARPFPVYGRV
jgi:hypothetical protein